MNNSAETLVILIVGLIVGALLYAGSQPTEACKHDYTMCDRD